MTMPAFATTGRYELKYVITPSQRNSFLSATRDALQSDPHGTNAVYRVSSVYYDTHDFGAYWEKVDGESIRRKYRLRFYAAAPHRGHDVSVGRSIRGDHCVGPAFMEIKHRIQNTVYKQRVRLTAEGAMSILNDASQLVCLHRHCDWSTNVDRSAVTEVEQVALRSRLEAKTLITYIREAWQGVADDRLRLTFDSLGQAVSPDAFRLTEHSRSHDFMPPNQLVMEVKFDSAIPRWIRDVLIDQGLTLQRFSKYAAGVAKPAAQYVRQMVANISRDEQPAVPNSGLPLLIVEPAANSSVTSAPR